MLLNLQMCNFTLASLMEPGRTGVSRAPNNNSTLVLKKLSDMQTLQENACKLSRLLQDPHSMLETAVTPMIFSLSAGNLTEPSLSTMA